MAYFVPQQPEKPVVSDTSETQISIEWVNPTLDCKIPPIGHYEIWMRKQNEPFSNFENYGFTK